jgi:competence protein ComEC
MVLTRTLPLPSPPAHRGGSVTLVYLAAGWTAGLILSHLLHQWGVISCATPAWLFPLLSGTALLCVGVLLHSARSVLVAAVSLALCLGAWRYHAEPFFPCLTPAHLAYYHQARPVGLHATVEGVIMDYPDVRDTRSQYRLAADRLVLGDHQLDVTGDVLVEAPRFPVYVYGDRLRATGRLQTPGGMPDFDYQRYLAQKGIFSLLRHASVEETSARKGSSLRGALYAARTRLSTVIDRLLPEPVAALANGMLLGIESGISDEVDEAFKATGASHVIIISGSNIALFSGVLMTWATRAAGRRRAALPVVALIAAYVVLIGADAAAFRAGIMGVLVVLAAYFGRRTTAYVSLCAAVIVLTAVNPLSLWDLGFQLSFLATLGLILFTRPMSNRLQTFVTQRLPRLAPRATGLLVETLVVTSAAQVATAPLLLYTFGRFSPVSLLVNALIMPVQPAVLAGGFAALGAGVVWEPLGRLVAVIPWVCLKYTIAVVELGAQLPGASVSVGGDSGAWALLLIAASMSVAAIWVHGRS